MFWNNRKEEVFEIKPKKPLETSQKPETSLSIVTEKLDTVSKQISILSRYVSHLSRKVDQAIYITKIQEEQLKEMKSRMNNLNPTFKKMSEKAIFSIEEES